MFTHPYGAPLFSQPEIISDVPTAPLLEKSFELAVELSEQPLRFLLGFKFDCELAMGNLLLVGPRSSAEERQPEAFANEERQV